MLLCHYAECLYNDCHGAITCLWKLENIVTPLKISKSILKYFTYCQIRTTLLWHAQDHFKVCLTGLRTQNLLFFAYLQIQCRCARAFSPVIPVLLIRAQHHKNFWYQFKNLHNKLDSLPIPRLSRLVLYLQVRLEPTRVKHLFRSSTIRLLLIYPQTLA